MQISLNLESKTVHQLSMLVFIEKLPWRDLKMEKVAKMCTNLRDSVCHEKEIEWEINGFDEASSSMEKYLEVPCGATLYDTSDFYQAPRYIFESATEEIDGNKWFFEASLRKVEEYFDDYYKNVYIGFKFKFFVDDHEANVNSFYKFELESEKGINKSSVIRNTSGAQCILRNDPQDQISITGINLSSQDSYKFKIRCRKVAYAADTKNENEKNSQIICIDEGESSTEIEVLIGTNEDEPVGNIITDEATLETTFEDLSFHESEQASCMASPVKFSQANDIEDTKKVDANDSDPPKVTKRKAKLHRVKNSSDQANESDETSDEEEEISPGQKNDKITRRIRNVYLTKMKQVADASSRLFLAAATVSSSMFASWIKSWQFFLFSL